MKKTDYKEIKLEKGTIFEYSFGEVKLLVYRTNDFIDDEAIMLVKNNKTVVIESPCLMTTLQSLSSLLKIQVLKLRVLYSLIIWAAAHSSECKEICY